MPRIHFLEPLLMEVCLEDGTELNLLIERELEEYEKFYNDVKGRKAASAMDSLTGSTDQLGLDVEQSSDAGSAELGSKDVEEEIEEEEESGKTSSPDVDSSVNNDDVHPSHFPPAFSHYTYEKGNRKLMVTDLRGVYEEHEDGTSRYVFTDPVIHHKKRGTKKQLVQWTFGRPDRGEMGMKAFFDTHECNEVCRLLGLHENLLDDGGSVQKTLAILV
jgi:hypothetical protein